MSGAMNIMVKCPKIFNVLFHTAFGLNFAFYTVIS